MTLGDLKQWTALLCLMGFVLIAALNSRRIIGGTLIGVLIVSLIGIPLGSQASAASCRRRPR